MTALPSPGQIVGRLETIDQQLAGTEAFEGAQDRLERTAQGAHEKKGAFEIAFAQAYVDAEGTNQKERESRALLSLAKNPAYTEYVAAEAEHKAAKLAYQVLETRASIAQSVLRAMKEESYR